MRVPEGPDRAADSAPLLSVRAVTKTFGGVRANDAIDFDVRSGEVHALLGENGAGKTTLISILYGLLQPDAGSLAVDGEVVRMRSPRDARARGIGLVAQHFHLARRHTVAENLALGAPDVPWFDPTRRLRRRIRELGDRYALPVDPDAVIARLSPGERQRVEILKALLQGARLLILDEPTSVLTPQEAESLFRVVDRMRSEGKAVVFISHKLDEVLRVADRLTVLRRGRVVGRLTAREARPEALARLMVGRELALPERRREARGDAPTALRLEDVWVRGDQGVPAVRGLSLEVRRGEIVGVAGVAGNGQSELAQALTGLRTVSAGRITLGGIDLTRLGPRGARDAGVAYIPEDRRREGVVAAFSVTENLVLRQFWKPPFARGPFVAWARAARFAERAIAAFDIKTPSRTTRAGTLSGGNVQKIVLARELAGKPALVVASHPTYGLDVGAAAQTQEQLIAQCGHGAAVVLISEDLQELLRLSDRILVLFEGRAMALVDAAEATPDRLGLWMAGHDAQMAAA